MFFTFRKTFVNRKASECTLRVDIDFVSALNNCLVLQKLLYITGY